MLNPITLSALRPFATCRKCTFAKNAAHTEQTGAPLCLVNPPVVNGEYPRVQSGDFCQHWTPKSPAVAQEALRILLKRGISATSDTCGPDITAIQTLAGSTPVAS